MKHDFHVPLKWQDKNKGDRDSHGAGKSQMVGEVAVLDNYNKRLEGEKMLRGFTITCWGGGALVHLPPNIPTL